MELQKITRKEFFDLIWSIPFSEISKKYIISNEDFNSLCDKMNIPKPTSGFWSKKRFNKHFEIPQLPSDYSGDSEITLTLQKEGEVYLKRPLTPIELIEQEIIKNEGSEIIVPKELTNPDKLIIAAQKSLSIKQAYSDHVSTSTNEPYILVTPENVNRALRIMDSFIKTIRKRGHQISIQHHTTYFEIYGEKIEIKIREKSTRVLKSSNSSWNQYDYVNSGILTFIAKIHFNNLEWKDGKTPLENQLARIIAKLEVKGEELKQEKIELKKYWAEQEAKRKIEAELQFKIETEFSNFKQLFQSSKLWHDAKILNQYLDEMETIARNENKNTEEFQNWLLWARKKANWYNPLMNEEDEFLSVNHKAKIAEVKQDNKNQYINIIDSPYPFWKK